MWPSLWAPLTSLSIMGVRWLYEMLGPDRLDVPVVVFLLLPYYVIALFFARWALGPKLEERGAAAAATVGAIVAFAHPLLTGISWVLAACVTGCLLFRPGDHPGESDTGSGS